MLGGRLLVGWQFDDRALSRSDEPLRIRLVGSVFLTPVVIVAVAIAVFFTLALTSVVVTVIIIIIVVVIVMLLRGRRLRSIILVTTCNEL